jgi:flagellar biosynthetic protein FliQ
MTDDTVLELSRQAFLACLKLGGPTLMVALVVGVGISILQAITQVQDATMTFVPKTIAIGLVLLVCGSWMLQSLLAYSGELFTRLPQFVR